jgi:hypothetical protein
MRVREIIIVVLYGWKVKREGHVVRYHCCSLPAAGSVQNSRAGWMRATMRRHLAVQSDVGENPDA